MYKKNIKIIYFIVLFLFFLSCTQTKKITYIYDITPVDIDTIFINPPRQYVLRPDDILYIDILSINPEINNLFNAFGKEYRYNRWYGGDISKYIYGYSIDDSGSINFPLLGKVKIAGLTIDQATDKLQTKLDSIFKDVTIIVKLLSFYVTVLGEVKSPGVYYNYKNYMTVLEAISKAGGITQFGDKTKVLIIRPTKNGTKTYKIDLTKKTLLCSDVYYLIPEDVIYIPPLKSKTFHLNTALISITLSLISTTILILNFIIKS